MTSTPTTGGLREHRPRQLPIRPRPVPGELPAAYIRRLARANHLRPNYLNRYLRDPDDPIRIRLDWLAAVAGRTPTALEHAFTQTGRTPPRPQTPRRRTKAARSELFALIRQDAHLGRRCLTSLAQRHGVNPRTINQALTSPDPPPHKKRGPRCSPLDPFKPVIDALLEEDQDKPSRHRRDMRAILRLLITQHQATDISYDMVRSHILKRRRAAGSSRRPTHRS